ncbi:hypothetical protein LWF15_00775 [Kineosporia rhizophila]|uniref:hypothetical protein n=1 Tax=Kineosporia TaxID=49184 RepID=UPI001E59B18D|nr:MULTISPECIES: hypothetical protein [Kineosporia]MCE0534039.1 hypothetical protein [Kineosporia rhizophila]GLY13580.1 hypothetical protein Kisp01_05960 [Kineosporia sp. NBRC 101677]
MSISTISSTAYNLSPYAVGQPGAATTGADYDAASGRSLNPAGLSPQNARTPSDLQAVQFRERRDERTPEPAPPNPDNATGVLSGSLTQEQQDTLNSLSSLLDTDTETLQANLQNGSTLADLAEQAGVNATTVASVSQDGLLFDTSV